MKNRIEVAILGATGLVGQRLLQLLAGHPWFHVRVVAASDQSVGKPYAAAVNWHLPGDIPAEFRDLIVQPCEPTFDTPLVFSALPSEVAGEIETSFANAGCLVSSNASNHRMDPHVPLVIPEVNPDHLALVSVQREKGRGGAIVCNPNCSTIHLTLALKPLADRFGLRRVIVTTMQALSGAGYPGVPSLDIVDNVVPFIGGEEAKLEREPLKLLGRLQADQVQPADFRISASCNRVATRDGHLESVSVEFVDKPASLAELRRALEDFRAAPQELQLPLAPAHPIIVRDEPDRPQPALDRDAERGMATVVGRLRACNVLDWKFSLLGHNTIRGAAGGTLLNAELLAARNLV